MEITRVSDRFRLVKAPTKAAKKVPEQTAPTNIGLSTEVTETDCGYWNPGKKRAESMEKNEAKISRLLALQAL